MAGTYSIGNTKIKGFDEVMHNLNTEIQKIEGRTMEGLIRAAATIRKDMDKTPPLIPVDTGNMRASWFVVTAKGNQENAPVFKNTTTKKLALLNSSYNAAVSESESLVKASSKENPFLIMGFGANYTMPVHEMYVGGSKNVKGEVGWGRKSLAGPKFFESAVKRNKDKVLKIIADKAKIK